jgi:translocation and assembly module TamB
MNPAASTNERGPPAPRAPRTFRAARWLTIALVLVAFALAAGAAFVASELALQIAVRIMVARSEGRLEVDGASGSLLSAVRAKRLVWRGPGATMTADDVAINWNPRALWSRGIVVKGLGAQRITLAIQPSDSAVPPPPTLALPTAVAIDEVAVADFEWTIGANSGHITGLTFGYAGGPAAHRVERLSLVLPSGTLTGTAAIDASAPFNLKGAFVFAGDVRQKPARADVALAGTLEAAGVDATGRAGDARFALHARLTPLAAVALDQLSLDAHDLDLNAWDAAMPATRLDVKAEGRPADGGIAGRFEAENAIAGPIDANRLPLRSISARFAWRASEVALDDLVAVLDRGGRITGSAQVPLGGGAGKWAVDVTTSISRHSIRTLAATTRSPDRSAQTSMQRGIGRRSASPIAASSAASRRRSQPHSSSAGSHRALPDSRRHRRARRQRAHRARRDAVRSS